MAWHAVGCLLDPWAEHHLARSYLVLLALGITSTFIHPHSQHQNWPLGGDIQGIGAESRGTGVGNRERNEKDQLLQELPLYP